MPQTHAHFDMPLIEDGTLIKRISLSACSVVSIHCGCVECEMFVVRVPCAYCVEAIGFFCLFLRAPSEPRTAACRSRRCAGFVRYRAARMRTPRRRLRCITGSDQYLMAGRVGWNRVTVRPFVSGHARVNIGRCTAIRVCRGCILVSANLRIFATAVMGAIGRDLRKSQLGLCPNVGVAR